VNDSIYVSKENSPKTSPALKSHTPDPHSPHYMLSKNKRSGSTSNLFSTVYTVTSLHTEKYVDKPSEYWDNIRANSKWYTLPIDILLALPDPPPQYKFNTGDGSDGDRGTYTKDSLGSRPVRLSAGIKGFMDAKAQRGYLHAYAEEQPEEPEQTLSTDPTHTRDNTPGYMLSKHEFEFKRMAKQIQDTK